MRVEIAAAASVLPEEVVTSEDVEARIRAQSPSLTVIPGSVRHVTGIETRRRACESINASDLAAEACRKVLEQAALESTAIDLLIYASASQDLVEPATAHIVQHKLGTRAAVMDVKNACNSFINGVQVAEALILSGQYATALVAVGETPSRSVKWAVANYHDFFQSFAGYTFGDAGAAVLLRAASTGPGIFYRRFWAASQYWDLGGLLTGGSMHPRGEEFTYFRGDGVALRQAFTEIGTGFLCEALRESGTSYQDYTRILIHQATIDYLDVFVRTAGIPRDRVVTTLPVYGNVAAATLPVGLDLAVQRGEITRGDKVMLVGLSGGISLGVLMFEF